MSQDNNFMVKDVVCAMQVAPKNAAGKSEYMSEVYYFCSLACKRAFEKEPLRYISPASQSGKSHA